MKSDVLKKVLTEHEKWLRNEGGSKADLRWADLSEANLSEADLSWADLRWANLSKADLRWADLSEANLSEADLSEANLSEADLRWADLSEANLSEADLSWADLRWANLSKANLSKADLRWADLRWANLSKADLSWANLSEADLSEADLRWADLSGAENLLSAIDFLDAHFERTAEGYIVYKTFNSQYGAPTSWKIEAGSIISEVANHGRTCDCGCGINVAPLEWVKKNYSGKTIYKLLIKWEWLAGVVVPYNTDGKIRCERAMIIGEVSNDRQRSD